MSVDSNTLNIENENHDNSLLLNSQASVSHASTSSSNHSSPISDSSLKSPSQKRRNQSSVKDYFEERNNKRYCIVEDCPKVFELTTGTSSLSYHLSSEHQIFAIPENKNGNSPKSPKLGADRRTNLDHQAINNLFIEFIIDDFQAFSLADSPRFKKFLYALNYRVPDRKTVREKISLKFNSYNQRIKSLLLNLNSKIHLSIDIWTSLANEPYIAFNCHFINQNWKLKNFLLDISYFPHPHSSEFINNALLDVINFFL